MAPDDRRRWMAPRAAGACCCCALGIGLLARAAGRGVRLPGPAAPGRRAGRADRRRRAADDRSTRRPSSPRRSARCSPSPGCVLGRLAGCASWPRRGCSPRSSRCFAWPSLLSGQASVAGLHQARRLGDLARADRAPDGARPRHLDGRRRRRSSSTSSSGSAQGYPIGTFMPVGVAAKLTGQDLVNAYQPVICVYVGMLRARAVRRRARAGPLARRWPRRVAVVGVQASLFVGYAGWGSIKEICVAALLPVSAARARRRPARAAARRRWSRAAFMAASAPAASLWAGRGLRRPRRCCVFARPLRALARCGGRRLSPCCVAGSVPADRRARRQRRADAQRLAVAQEDIGKLFAAARAAAGRGAVAGRRLPRRARPALDRGRCSRVLGLVAAAGAVVASRSGAARGCCPRCSATVVVGAVPALVARRPVDRREGAGHHRRRAADGGRGAGRRSASSASAGSRAPRRRARSPAAASSSWLAGRDVYVAPRDSLTELRDARRRSSAGKGPMLLLNYEGYATRYLLGPAPTIEGATRPAPLARPVALGRAVPELLDGRDRRRRHGGAVRLPADRPPADAGRLAPAERLRRRSRPAASSRPGGGTRRRRPSSTCRSAAGSRRRPTSTCRAAARARARAGSTLVAAPRENPVVVNLATRDMPVGVEARRASVRPATRRHRDAARRAARRGPLAGVGRRRRPRLAGGARRRQAGRQRAPPARRERRLDALRRARPRRRATTSSRSKASRSWWQAGRGTAAGQLPLGPVALHRRPSCRRSSASRPTTSTRLCDGRTYDWVEALD